MKFVFVAYSGMTRGCSTAQKIQSELKSEISLSPEYITFPLLPSIWIHIQIVSEWCGLGQVDSELWQLHLRGRILFHLSPEVKSQKEVGERRKVQA